MSPKRTLVLFLCLLTQKIVSPLNTIGGTNQQFIDKLNEFVSHIENKTQGLFDVDKEIHVNKHEILKDKEKNSLNNYMIKKEKEKLSIIPMYPVKLNQKSDNQNNTVDEEKLYLMDSSEDGEYLDYNYDDDYQDQQNMEEPYKVIQETRIRLLLSIVTSPAWV